MIKIIEGNLLDASEDIIGHQVNCQGVMGSGVAKSIKDKWRTAYIGYSNYCFEKNPCDLLGELLLVNVSDNKFIAHLFGQQNYGRRKVRYTDYDALEQALHKLRTVAERNKLSVALPYNIGCGLANGDWNVVYEIIDKVFSDYQLTLYKLD